MLTNSEMIPNRFFRLQRARRMYGFILEHFKNGRLVTVSTHLRSTTYRSANFFVLKGLSVYVRRGKSLDCIDYCRISAS